MADRRRIRRCAHPEGHDRRRIGFFPYRTATHWRHLGEKANWRSLILAAPLIPFALLYVYGVACLLRRSSAVLPLTVLVAIVTFVTPSEILVNRVVFASEHNWFHR